MVKVVRLNEGKQFIDSLLHTLPSLQKTRREYLPPEIVQHMPAPVVPPTPAPIQRTPRQAPARQPAPPAGAPPAQGGNNYGDPGYGTKRFRFETIYRNMNGSGLTRHQMMQIGIDRLEMTRAGAGTYMANAARDIGPWRLA